jgi:AcrR family transcriptional regulator
MRPTQSECKKRILSDVIPLFAKSGYDRVTMREIAAKARITAGSLYHHFPSKQELYLEAMKQAFTDSTRRLTEALSADRPPADRLRNLVFRFCKQLQKDRVFSRLIHREILDGNEKRFRMIVDQVFKEFFSEITRMCKELAPMFDPYLLAISVVALAAYHYQITPIRKYLPGGRPTYDNPEIVAQHIITLLMNGIRPRSHVGIGKKFQGDQSA